MLITAIEKRRKMLSALFLDGEFAVNIDTETLLQFRYKIGMDITDEQLHELILASDARRANEKALYFLEHRSHSKKELIEKIQRTTSKEAARSAADRMEELGLSMMKSLPNDMLQNCSTEKDFPADVHSMNCCKKALIRKSLRK